MDDLLTRRALRTAARLIEAAAANDHSTMLAILTHITPEAEPESDLIATVVERSCSAFGTTLDRLVAGARDRETVDARAVACYAAHLLGHKYSHIGRQIGRDHSTVMHAVGRVGETPRLRAIAQRIAGQFGWDREAS